MNWADENQILSTGLNLTMMVKVLGISRHHVEPSGGVGVHHKRRSVEVHLSLEMLVDLAEL